MKEDVSKMKDTQSIFYLLVFALLFALTAKSWSVRVASPDMINLPLGHPAYDFINRMMVKGVVPKVVTNILPLTRGEVAWLLKQISDKVGGQETKLTDAELARLKDLRVLFADELERLGLKVNGKPHFLQAKGEEYNFSFDADFSQELTSLRAEVKASVSSLRPTVIGSIKDNFAFATDIHSHLVMGEPQYYPYHTETTFHFSENVDGTSTFNAYIKFKLPWFELQLGKDNLWWGPGRYGALMISDNAPSWDMLKLSAHYGKFRFTSFTGILRSRLGDKYISGHRLEALVFPKLLLGIQEVQVYANRFEIHNLNPVTIYFFSEVPLEEASGINDNMLAGLTFELLPVKNLKLYGELMIDDLQMQEMPNIRYWANPFGILFGVYYVDPFGFDNTDLCMEYVFVNQFAYTHAVPITRYQHDDYVIGHWLGPDADDLRCDISHHLSNRLSLKLTYELERQGEGAIDKTEPPPGVQEWEFLSGTTESKRSLGLEFKYQVIGRYAFLMSYKYLTIRNKDNERGNKSNSHVFGLEVGYRF